MIRLLKYLQLIVIRNIPKVNPYVAIKALLTIMIPTEVTMLNIHADASTAAFLLDLFAGGIFMSLLSIEQQF